MRISQLAERAGLPVATVKYYQREGLLPEGVRSAPNQVQYGDAHVRRVRLIRALLETGGLSVAATLFGAVYLLAHGAVKVVLVWAVLANRLWAYPWMIGFLIVFIGYQAYRLAVGFSCGVALLTAFDIFIVVLTWREYMIRRRR